MRTLIFVCSLLGIALTACTRTDTLSPEVTGAFEQAFTRDDLAATAALFSEDAQILPQHGPVLAGSSEIERFLKDQMTPVTSFNTETDMSLVRDDIAIEQGHYRVRDVRRGSDVELGKYLHIWRRENGDWKIFRIIYNTDVAPATQVSVNPEGS